MGSSNAYNVSGWLQNGQKYVYVIKVKHLRLKILQQSPGIPIRGPRDYLDQGDLDLHGVTGLAAFL